MDKETFREFCEKSIGELLYTEKVTTCAKIDSIKSVLEKMAEKNIGAVIVVEGGRPVGIFTERDLLRKIVLKINNLESTSIESVMTPNPVCIFPETPFSKVMAAMRLGKFRHLVVVDRNSHLKGVVSIKDVVARITEFVAD